MNGYAYQSALLADGKRLLVYAEDNAGTIDLKFQEFDQNTNSIIGSVTSYQTTALSSDYLSGSLNINPSDANGSQFGVELSDGMMWMQPARYYKLSSGRRKR